MSMFGLLKTLVEAQVEFVLVGGLAVALHGYQRVTMDVDVVLAMDEANLQQFIAAAKAADLRRDATMVGIGAINIAVASIEHLIALKTGTGRNKDLIDIEELRKIQAQKC